MRAGVQGIGFALLTLLPCSALAAVPLKLPIQGLVRDNAGAPGAEDVFSARFALYDTPDAILPIWVEHWPPEAASAPSAPGTAPSPGPAAGPTGPYSARH